MSVAITVRGGARTFLHVNGDRPAARAHFQAAPPLANAEPVQVTERDGVVDRRQAREPRPCLRRGVVERILGRSDAQFMTRFTAEVLSYTKWSNELGERDRVDARSVGRRFIFR